MDTFPLLVLLLSCRIEVGALNLSPGTLTVLRGEKARFTCTPSSNQWTVMIWLVGGSVALTVSNEIGVLPSINPNVMAEKKEGGWMFVLNNTERHNQGEVTCDLQGIDRKTARLFVQEKGSVKVLGENRLAFQGQSVLFECQAAGWYPQPVLKWQVNDKEVGLSEYNISSEESGERLFTLTSNLSVLAAKSSHVDCLASVSALPKPLKSRISLKVVAEVLQEGGDCTVPVAITASLSAFLLLILLCICTVLCYRQRRQAKASPQEVLRFDQSVFGRSAVAGAPEGKVNLGYSSEGSTDAVNSELFWETHRQMDFVSFHKVPDVVSSSSFSTQGESQANMCPPEESCKNVRRITTV
ncbi:immunoglobulin superfamily member 5-like isoform X2 [Archocentrus centrarchus]|uniref:immunoglobulin superfamily member 5-like isoform X2 n=1 Tax=Archocentrus centrarchus TaxID=63155 RepID=UPI0011EA44C4|nr:immunoglobulin superfamily member 5-like isoform X2 [Archocentrus centrarchus]XP_030599424.1 immunoglobulin superfamily member 5-like isoform X2 [Archocentrus centrarchus]